MKHKGHILTSAILGFASAGLMIGSAFAEYAPTFWLGVALLIPYLLHVWYVVGLVQEDVRG